MAHASQNRSANLVSAAPWRRSLRRPWPRPRDPASEAYLLATIPSLPRPVLARLAERMIDRMDEIDGDPDTEVTFEDDEDGSDREGVFY